MLALRLLLVPHGLLLFQLHAALGIKLIIAAGIISQVGINQMQNAGDRTVQQCPVMRNHQHRMFIFGNK